MIAAPKTRQSLLSGKHEMFDAGKGPAKCRPEAEPVVPGPESGLQGRKVIAAPKTLQSLFSGEHKMFDAGKSAGPNCRPAK